MQIIFNELLSHDSFWNNLNIILSNKLTVNHIHSKWIRMSPTVYTVPGLKEQLNGFNSGNCFWHCDMLQLDSHF